MKTQRLIDLPVREIIERAATAEPEPGGGSVAALTAALAAGLAGMVCALTVGRPRYQEVSDDLACRQEKLADLRQRLTQLIDEDVRAYGQVTAAYALPKNTDEERQRRDGAVATGLIAATETPLELAELAADVAEHAAVIARVGNRTAVDDAVTAVFLAETAARGALRNAATNLRLLRPERTPPALAERARTGRSRVAGLAAVVSGFSE